MPGGRAVDLGLVHAPEAPELGVRRNLNCVREHLQPVRVEAAGEALNWTPDVDC